MHLSEEQLQRLMDDELPWTEVSPVREHVAQCAACRDRLDAERRDEREIVALLRFLDHAPPPVSATTLIARARSREWSWIGRAAAILVAVSIAGVAWAAPGSPVRAFLGHAVEWMHRSQGSETQRAPAPATPTMAGIAVAPGAKLVILFASARAGSAAHVSLTDSEDVVVRAPVGAAAFTSNDDRLVIENAGSSATFEIEIPRTAPHVEIRIAGRAAFTKDGAHIVANGVAQRGNGYVIPLARPRP